MVSEKEHLYWKKLRSSEEEDLTIFQLQYHWMEHPTSKKVLKTTVLNSKDAVNVIAITPEQELLFVRQFRFGTEKITLELPGGFIDANERPVEAAQRELREETGYASSEWKELSYSDANPVFMDNQIHHWIARNAEPKYNLALDEGEAIELVKIPCSKIASLIRDNIITHPHSLVPLLQFLLFDET